MARLNNKKAFSGLIGNLVFRTLEGQQIVQSRPNSVKQTSNTKASALEFRHCSIWAKQLRLDLWAFLNKDTDSYMFRRLTGNFYKAVMSNTNILKGQRTPLNANMSDLVGFDFNLNSPFKDYFLPEIEVTVNSQKQITVVVPELEPKTQVKYPERTIEAELLVYVYAGTLVANAPITEAFVTIPIDRAAIVLPETSWTSPVLPDNHLVVVSAKLLYYTHNKFTGKNYLNNAQLSPSMILFANTI